MALQQFGGVNGIAFYASAIFISAGFSGSAGMIAMVVVQAATYGLPIVATKNGGPIDIHRVLDNGLFVDPHDHQSIANALLKLQFIADALLKLVANRQIF